MATTLLEDIARNGIPAPGDVKSRSKGVRPVRAAVVDPRPMMRGALVRWVRTIGRTKEVSPFACASALLAGDDDLAGIDVILLSDHAAELGAADRSATIAGLVGRFADKPVVILSDSEDIGAAVAAIRVGARGYIPTTFEPAVAVAALKLVLAGGTFVPAAALLFVAEPPQAAVRSASPSGVVGVTRREVEVLGCLMEGKQNKLIAHQLKMRESTVKVHVRHLMKKLDATNRTEVAVRAQGLLAARPKDGASANGVTVQHRAGATNGRAARPR